MDEAPDFGFIAKKMIQSHGERAMQVIERRVADRSRDGNTKSARFWWRVALLGTGSPSRLPRQSQETAAPILVARQARIGTICPTSEESAEANNLSSRRLSG
jgi:hypothetical protein